MYTRKRREYTVNENHTGKIIMNNGKRINEIACGGNEKLKISSVASLILPMGYVMATNDLKANFCGLRAVVATAYTSQTHISSTLTSCLI